MSDNHFFADGKDKLTRRDFLRFGGISVLAVSSTMLASCTPKQFEDIITWMTELAVAINNYRIQNGLSEIPISDDLTAVAMKHCIDLNTYHPEQACGANGNLHSWSNNGNWAGAYGQGAWKGCCYPADHSNAACMWDKPKEITNYPDYGYEISHYSTSTVTAQSALSSWKSSQLHNDVILNKGDWQSLKWQALGAIYSNNYACAWFGVVKS